MSIINNVSEVLHRIRCKLYPNYLPNVQGAFIARTDSEALLSIEQVCAALKNRGGYTGRFDELVDGVKEFLNETTYQLCDGFAVNVGYFSIHPNIGGTFNSANEIHDHKKHPISFSFRVRSPLHRLAELIKVEIEGLADNSGYIDEFVNVSEDTINDTVTPGGQFIIHGSRIKIAGDDPNSGIFFESEEEGGLRAKVEAKLAENSPSRIIGIVPELPHIGSYRLVIVTQFSSGGTFLKEPRSIKAGFTLTMEGERKKEG